MPDVLPISNSSEAFSSTRTDRLAGQSHTIRVVQDSPKRLPIVEEQSDITKSSKPSPRRVRFEDFPLPPALLHPNSGVKLPNTAHVEHFRSAALGTLLPIAASQGIARPVDLDERVGSAQRSPAPLIVTRLYTQGEVCRHRARELGAGATGKDHNVLATAMAAMDPVDGAVEISEKSDMCWRCAVRSGIHVVADLLLHCACAKKGRENVDQEDYEEEGRAAWNNV